MTFIAVMDEKGFASFAAVGNVANRARVTLDEAKAAITVLENPDPESSDPENEGRRLERVPGGWIVLNAEKHRDLVTRAVRQAQTAERVRRHRERKRNGNADVTPSEAYSGSVTEEETKERSEERAVSTIRVDPTPEVISTSQPSAHVARLQTPIFGKNQHLTHVACDDTFSYCVPDAVHRKLADLLAPKHAGDRDAAKAELAAWYLAQFATIPAGTVMGDAFRFWQSRFDAAFASAPAKKISRTAAAVEKIQKAARDAR